MKRWAIIHQGSGAIISIVSREVSAPPSGTIVKEVPDGISPDVSWWDGSAFADRQVATISAASSVAEAGSEVALTKPIAGAWFMRTDGAIGNGAKALVQSGYKQNRFTLIGRYKGEATVEVVAAGQAVPRLQTDLLAKLKYDAERRKMLCFSPGNGKAQEYVQKGKEATASAGIIATVLNSLTAANAAAQYPMAHAERIMTGDTLYNVLASYRAGKAASDAELARLSAIERKAVLAIKAAATAAAKQAAYDAVNWSATV